MPRKDRLTKNRDWPLEGLFSANPSIFFLNLYAVYQYQHKTAGSADVPEIYLAIREHLLNLLITLQL